MPGEPPEEITERIEGFPARVTTNIKWNDALSAVEAFAVTLEYCPNTVWQPVAVIPHGIAVRDDLPDIYDQGICVYQYRDSQIRYMRREVEPSRIQDKEPDVCLLLGVSRLKGVAADLIETYNKWA